jgi:transposase
MTYFLQDGAPFHVSKRIKSFLADKPFEVMDWPGNSPDLNPIEKCWNYLKQNLKDKDTVSMDKLIAAVKMLWVKSLSREHLKKLRDSIPRRIQSAGCEGGHYQLLMI